MSFILNCVHVQAAILGLYMCFNFSQGYITYIAARLPLRGNRSSPGAPWPMPQVWQKNPLVLSIDPPGFKMDSDIEGCDIIEHALKRYRRLVFYDTKAGLDSTLDTLTGLKIQITNGTCEKYLRQNSDEYYELDIENAEAKIKTRSVWGALRGLDTFSQLIYINSDKKYHINVTSIRDWPRFPYRGLLVDTARHYLPMSILLKNLDAMSYNKLNVMHWHIVDDQSFPYVSVKFPELSQKGAYSSRHIYTQSDVARVIEYARLRGIRVIPEFDTPGHTQSWGKAFPELMTPCWADQKPYQAEYGKHAISENFDPTKNKTYEFMREFLGEIVTVFKDEYIDLGMDEAHYYCWQSSPNISDFMEKQGFQPDEYYKLEQVYSTKVIDIARSLGAKVYIYQDPIEHGAKVQNDTVIRVWKDTELWPGHFEAWQSYATNITKDGYHVIISACWYLNYISYGEDWRKYYLCEPFNFTVMHLKLSDQVRNDTVIRVWKGHESWQSYVENITKDGYDVVISSCWYLNYISYGQDWRKYYLCEPFSFKGSQKEYNRVLGGEASLWAEYVDGTNILQRLWPRLSAVAERLWSDADVKDADSAAFRLDEQRCRLVRRGIPAQPILPGNCGEYDLQEETDDKLTTEKPATCPTSAAGLLSLPGIIFITIWICSCIIHL